MPAIKCSAPVEVEWPFLSLDGVCHGFPMARYGDGCRKILARAIRGSTKLEEDVGFSSWVPSFWLPVKTTRTGGHFENPAWRSLGFFAPQFSMKNVLGGHRSQKAGELFPAPRAGFAGGEIGVVSLVASLGRWAFGRTALRSCSRARALFFFPVHGYPQA